jgi:hypothetical protein
MKKETKFNGVMEERFGDDNYNENPKPDVNMHDYTFEMP